MNFRTLKNAGLLYGQFTDLLPNDKHVDWDNAAVASDFGVPVEGFESPWAAFQFVLEYNAATVGDAPPTSHEVLREWIHANPGRFTYPAPPNHVGSALVRMLFYWAAGAADKSPARSTSKCTMRLRPKYGRISTISNHLCGAQDKPTPNWLCLRPQRCRK